MWGSIYLVKEKIHKNWSFPFDEKEKQEKDLLIVKQAMKDIGEYHPNDFVSFNLEKEQDLDLGLKLEKVETKPREMNPVVTAITTCDVPINMDMGKTQDFINKCN